MSRKHELQAHGAHIPYNDMFVWNHYLLEPLKNVTRGEEVNYWLIPIIHGSFVQHSAYQPERVGTLLHDMSTDSVIKLLMQKLMHMEAIFS
jgi:hypothetical protein